MSNWTNWGLGPVPEFVEAKVEKQLNDKTSIFATKEDIASVRLEVRETEVRLTRAIYIVGVVQFLATIGSVLMLLKYHL
jgi:hypothetical protein